MKSLVITHGHEDHIGGIPYLLKELNIPIYGMRFPLGLIENKLKEHNLKASMRVVEAGEQFRIGKTFRVEALRITHSIADSMCLSITTPAGRIFHTGDFKIDYTPIDGKPIDFARLAPVSYTHLDVYKRQSSDRRVSALRWTSWAGTSRTSSNTRTG